LAESFDLTALIGEFREEARDQLDRVDAGFLEIEREGALDTEGLSALLRTLHTLKGNAGMLGLSPIRDFVHVVENVLKAEPDSWPDALVERLFEGMAKLRAATHRLGTPPGVTLSRGPQPPDLSRRTPTRRRRGSGCSGCPPHGTGTSPWREGPAPRPRG